MLTDKNCVQNKRGVDGNINIVSKCLRFHGNKCSTIDEYKLNDLLSTKAFTQIVQNVKRSHE